MTKSTLTKLVLPAFMALGLALLPGTIEAKGGTGPKANFVKGKVEYSAQKDGPFKKLKRKKKVPAGHFVRTGAKARVELKFADGSIIRLGPSSLLHVEEAGYSSKTKTVNVEATLMGGKAWSKVSKLVGSDAKFSVKTQNAVAGVRGTIFRLDTDKDQATVIKVYDGSVAVSNSPFFANKGKSAEATTPFDPKGRKEIATPFQEISKKDWEQLVGRMMQVRISANGQMSSAMAFNHEEDKAEDTEWVNWNEACDKDDCGGY
ncbi:MAG: FecR domain-containing protein [Deltaproteobacteria bacterium]|nr:FecR domain-containing protein [Deltaproteobacteria bacterium]